MPAIANGANHTRGHSRTSMSQKLPLQPTPINGGPRLNGSIQLESEPKQHVHSHSLHTHTGHDHERTHLEHSRSRSQLPTPSLPPTNMENTRPKGIRRISVGLPTHLKLERSNYGYQPAAKPTYATSSEGRKRRTWFTASEMTASILILTPYIIIQIANNLESGSQSIKDAVPRTGIHDQPENPRAAIPHLLPACALTSGTLLVMGTTDKIRRVLVGQDEQKAAVPGHKRTSSFTALQVGSMTGLRFRQVISRLLGVGLPFYAAIQLGSDRVGLFMLVALVTEIANTDTEPRDLLTKSGVKRLFNSRVWTLTAMLFQLMCDISGLTNTLTASQILLGYLALSLCVFALPPPFPTVTSKKSYALSPVEPPPSSRSKILTTLKEIPSAAQQILPQDRKVSPLVHTAEDVNLTLIVGTALGILTSLVYLFIIPSGVKFSSVVLIGGLSAILTTALALTTAQPQSLRQSKGIGSALGCLLSCSILTMVGHASWIYFVYQASVISVSHGAVVYDTHKSISIPSHHHPHTQSHGHSHQHSEQKASDHHGQPSRISRYLLGRVQGWPLLHSILVEKDSRRIFYFMILNFAFMLVQTFYGIATGSLGLLSDSIHMFFDCLALVVGLCAAVMSKWPPSTRFPYGFGKMDTLAGFANGIFLMLISVEIVYEAIERLAEGSEMHRLKELLTVSGLGLVVNIIGMTAFGHAHHGHGHSHGGHDHGHAHESHDHPDHAHEEHDHTHHDHEHHTHVNHDHHGHNHLHDHLHSCPTPSPLSVPATPSKPSHSHSHAHGHAHHHHHHGNENMHGIFLHIMADTLGSVAVVISTLLINYYGWVGFDPLASVLIAVLIFASAIPLVASSARTLLLTIPEDTEFDLREALAGVSALRGVVGYAVPKFWLEEGDDRRVLGVIHVVAARGADMEDVKERAVAFLRTRNMNVLVQVEREGSGRCWCRGGVAPSPLSSAAAAFAAKAG